MCKRSEKSDLIILSKTRPHECGGTDATQDPRAPKEIQSQDMVQFEATSQLHGGYVPSRTQKKEMIPLSFVSAFAVPGAEGSFLFLCTREGQLRRPRENCQQAWAYVKANAFPDLDRLVRECDLARQNGFHSKTHGLPQDFGGSVYISYADGEKISFANNQHPILTFETGSRIAEYFAAAMDGEPVALPNVAALKEIRFLEQRKNGGFTKATLTLHADGTGTNVKASRYDDPKVYESEKPVDAQTVEAIQRTVTEKGLLAWASLPRNPWALREIPKTLTFLFEDGQEVTVPDDRWLPHELSRGFFDIELELTVKR
ncbi:MAG: hypothetical protein IKI50_01525 [Clostridia bacterium]|nr:hypothetical protein [Clostridia bacterium]